MKLKNPLLFITLILAVIIFFPLATIWSLNTLFQIGIAYTFKTWLAAVFLQMVTFGSIKNSVHQKSK